MLIFAISDEGGRWPIKTLSALALAVVCGVDGPSMSNPEGGGHRGGRWGWLATDNGAVVMSQKWQRCRKNALSLALRWHICGDTTS